MLKYFKPFSGFFDGKVLLFKAFNNSTCSLKTYSPIIEELVYVKLHLLLPKLVGYSWISGPVGILAYMHMLIHDWLGCARDMSRP